MHPRLESLLNSRYFSLDEQAKVSCRQAVVTQGPVCDSHTTADRSKSNDFGVQSVLTAPHVRIGQCKGRTLAKPRAV